MGRVHTGISCVPCCIQDRLGCFVLLVTPRLSSGFCCRYGPRNSATDGCETLVIGGRRWRLTNWPVVAHQIPFDSCLWEAARIRTVVVYTPQFLHCRDHTLLQLLQNI